MIRPLSNDCSLLPSLSSVWAPSYTPVMTGGYQVTPTEEPASRPITLGRSNSPCLWQKQVPPRPPPEVCARGVDYEQPHLLAHQPLKRSRRSHSSSSPFPQVDGVTCDKLRHLDFEARQACVPSMSLGQPSYATCKAHWGQNLPWVECPREKASEWKTAKSVQ